MLMVAGLAGSSLPGAIVGHRTFDGEEPPVMVKATIRKKGGFGSGSGITGSLSLLNLREGARSIAEFRLTLLSNAP